MRSCRQDCVTSHHSLEMCLWGQNNTPKGGPVLIPGTGEPSRGGARLAQGAN